MAGITDRTFRQLCRETGADTGASEMIIANPDLLADMARCNVDKGAEIIDINRGCPAKKVCNTLAGSVLLRDEKLVVRLQEAVTTAVAAPVTLKIRTGWDPASKNAVRVARKHIGWYCSHLPAAGLRSSANRAGYCGGQLGLVRDYFSEQRTRISMEPAA